MKIKSWKEGKQLYFLAVIFVCFARIGNCGKTATKAGLAGITQVQSSSSSYNSNLDDMNNDLSYSARQANKSALRYLKFTLFHQQGYDKAVRPVLKKNSSVEVSVDLSYIQVLNLNEKEQTLTSLIYYRLYWKDAFLAWDPEQYDDIKDIWLPANSIWMPDVVCLEETGSRDFNPRIPFVVVHYDGTVRYLEPTALQTTCEIKISYFPFDQQTCYLTFSSWTFPTGTLDLSARRPASALMGEIDRFFVNSGEWMLTFIDLEKTSTSYLHLSPDLGQQLQNFTKEERKVFLTKSFTLDPQLTVREALPLRTTDLHWSEVKYTVVFRRNSLTHIQSMLFPAMLLTAISIMGFYLPPESGERIGLQITILLTFMVFILTVGDMFPASTGPYLGVYFVLCMALLGLNIIMTVLVLHLHHIPCKLILMVDPITGESRSNLRILPYWIRLGMILTGVYYDLKTFAIPAMKSSHKGAHEKKITLGNILQKWRSHSQSRVGERKNGFATTITNDHAESRQGLNPKPNKPHLLPGFLTDKIIVRDKKTELSPRNRSTNTLDSNLISSAGSPRERTPSRKSGSKNWKENISLLQKIMSELSEIAKNLTSLTSHSNTRDSTEKHKSAEVAMEEKWKSVARKVDFHCMIAYISLMVIFHVVIALVVVFGA